MIVPIQIFQNNHIRIMREGCRYLIIDRYTESIIFEIYVTQNQQEDEWVITDEMWQEFQQPKYNEKLAELLKKHSIFEDESQQKTFTVDEVREKIFKTCDGLLSLYSPEFCQGDCVKNGEIGDCRECLLAEFEKGK